MSSLRDLADDVSRLESIAETWQNSPRVITATRRLQIALLTAAATDVRSKLGRQPKPVDSLTPVEANYARTVGGKIQAIKLVRERKNLNPDGSNKVYGEPGYFGLREAKDFVEDWMERNLGSRVGPAVPYVDDYK